MRYTKVYYRIELAVWCTVIVPCGDRTIALEALAHPVPPKDNCGGRDAVCAEGTVGTPAEQHVGCDLDARTHISQHTC